MFYSSPITTWEGAAAFFNWAGSSAPVFSVVVMAILCLIPLLTAMRAENAAEKKYGSK